MMIGNVSEKPVVQAPRAERCESFAFPSKLARYYRAVMTSELGQSPSWLAWLSTLTCCAALSRWLTKTTRPSKPPSVYRAPSFNAASTSSAKASPARLCVVERLPSFLRLARNPSFSTELGPERHQKQDVSFICVPIKWGQKTIGIPSDHLFSARLTSGRCPVLQSCSDACSVSAPPPVATERLRSEETHDSDALKIRFRPRQHHWHSKSMKIVYDQIAKVFKRDATVLVRGVCGVGKELVAHALHYNSDRASRPFVKVNCAALSPTLLESELFGHEQGAFTGATKQRLGRFEMANSGTIFLDEIGDFPMSTQIMLLRFLQEKEFERAGGTKTTNGCPNHRCNQQIWKNRSRKERSERTLLPTQCISNHGAISSGATNGHPTLGGLFHRALREGTNKTISRISTPAIDMLTCTIGLGMFESLETASSARFFIRRRCDHGHHLPPTSRRVRQRAHNPRTLQEALDNLERELLESLRLTAVICVKLPDLGNMERIMGLRVQHTQSSPISYSRSP